MRRSRGEGSLVGHAQARRALLPGGDRGSHESRDVLSRDGFQGPNEVALRVLQHPRAGLIAQVTAGLG